MSYPQPLLLFNDEQIEFSVNYGPQSAPATNSSEGYWNYNNSSYNSRNPPPSSYRSTTLPTYVGQHTGWSPASDFASDTTPSPQSVASALDSYRHPRGIGFANSALRGPITSPLLNMADDFSDLGWDGRNGTSPPISTVRRGSLPGPRSQWGHPVAEIGTSYSYDSAGSPWTDASIPSSLSHSSRSRQNAAMHPHPYSPSLVSTPSPVTSPSTFSGSDTSSPSLSRRQSIDSTPSSPPLPHSRSSGSNGTQKVCSHCRATSTPLWRREPLTLKPLCNACGLYLTQRNKLRPQELIDADNDEESESSESGPYDGPECSHCHTRNTSVWRRSPTGEQLCNACGVYRRLRGKDRPLSLKRNKIKPRSKHTVGGAPTPRKAPPTRRPEALAAMGL